MITVETKARVTIFTVTGDVTVADIVEKAVAHVSSQPTELTLWDFTAANRVKLTTPELKGLVDRLNTAYAGTATRHIALVGSGNVNIGLGKLFVAFAQMAGVANHYKVFRTVETAMQWLAHRT